MNSNDEYNPDIYDEYFDEDDFDNNFDDVATSATLPSSESNSDDHNNSDQASLENEESNSDDHNNSDQASLENEESKRIVEEFLKKNRKTQRTFYAGFEARCKVPEGESYKVLCLMKQALSSSTSAVSSSTSALSSSTSALSSSTSSLPSSTSPTSTKIPNILKRMDSKEIFVRIQKTKPVKRKTEEPEQVLSISSNESINIAEDISSKLKARVEKDQTPDIKCLRYVYVPCNQVHDDCYLVVDIKGNIVFSHCSLQNLKEIIRTTFEEEQLKGFYCQNKELQTEVVNYIFCKTLKAISEIGLKDLEDPFIEQIYKLMLEISGSKLQYNSQLIENIPKTEKVKELAKKIMNEYKEREKKAVILNILRHAYNITNATVFSNLVDEKKIIEEVLELPDVDKTDYNYIDYFIKKIKHHHVDMQTEETYEEVIDNLVCSSSSKKIRLEECQEKKTLIHAQYEECCLCGIQEKPQEKFYRPRTFFMQMCNEVIFTYSLYKLQDDYKMSGRFEYKYNIFQKRCKLYQKDVKKFVKRIDELLKEDIQIAEAEKQKHSQ